MPRVLLVDDDIAEISAVKRVLARAGHQALLATNASDALGAVARTPPAVLVVASTCEGGEALRRLAEDGVAGALPMLVLGESADAPPGAEQIARPVDPSQLADRLAAALGGAPAPRPEPHAVARIAVDRRAAADALRARAEELRRGAVTSSLPAAAPSAAPALRRRRAPAPPPPELEAPTPPDAGAEARFGEDLFAGEVEGGDIGLGSGAGLAARSETPVSFGEDAPLATETPVTFAEEPPPPPDAAYSFGLEDEQGGGGYDLAGRVGGGGEAVHDSHAEADAALAELEAPTRGAAPAGLDLAQDPGLEALLRRAEQAEAAARAQEEARRAQEEARRAEEEAAARAAADEEARRAEEQRRRADDEARRAAEAEERALREREARETADRELQRLRRELEESRRAAEERARAVIEAARAEEEEQRRRAEAEEEQLRAAIQSARADMEALRKRSGAEEEQLRAAIQSARAEMEALRRRGEEEARRRAEAEAEAARLARDAEDARSALEAEREAVEAEAARRTEDAERRAREAEERAAEAERHADERAAEAERSAAERTAPAAPPPLEMPVYRPPAADPAPDPAQESARRRVAALRERGPAPAAAPPPSAAVAPPEEEPPRAPVRPPPPELRSGTLAELPAPRLLALAARARLGGRIDVEGGAARSLFFEAGRIVGATSSAPAERVEEVALRLGLVTRDQHRIVAASAAPLATRRAAVLLLERGFLKPNELAPLVRRRTEEVVFGVFGDAGARFRWSAAEVPPDESTALDRSALQLAVEGVRRRWLAPELEGVLGGDATLLAPAQNGPSAADLGLSGEDRRVLALADGLRTLDEIVAASPLDPLTTRQLLAALVLVGALGVRTFQAGRPAAAASTAIDLARVRDKLEQVRRADYFTVLGVGRLCTPHEVRDAHDRLRAEFDVRRFQGVREEGLEARLEEILRVVEDARDVLADDFLRAEYLRGLGE